MPDSQSVSQPLKIMKKKIRVEHFTVKTDKLVALHYTIHKM